MRSYEPKESTFSPICFLGQRGSLRYLRQRIKKEKDPHKKIELCFDLLKKSPSLSDAIFIHELSTRNLELGRACWNKIRILRKREAQHAKDLGI